MFILMYVKNLVEIYDTEYQTDMKQQIIFYGQSIIGMVITHFIPTTYFWLWIVVSLYLGHLINKKTMEKSTLTQVDQRYYHHVKHLRIKAKVDLYDVKELFSFLNRIQPYLVLKSEHVFIARECESLIIKLYKKITSINKPKSITVGYFEIFALNYTYKLASTIYSEADIHANFPQVHNILFDRIRNQIPNIFNYEN